VHWDHEGCGGAGIRRQNPNCHEDPDSIMAVIYDCSMVF